MTNFISNKQRLICQTPIIQKSMFLRYVQNVERRRIIAKRQEIRIVIDNTFLNKILSTGCPAFFIGKPHLIPSPSTSYPQEIVGGNGLLNILINKTLGIIL